MEFVMVASAATILSAVSFGAVQSFAKVGRVQTAKGMLFHMRASLKLYRMRVGAYPASAATVQAGTYAYNYDTWVGLTGYLYHNGVIPSDPFKNVSTIIDGVAPSGTGGWWYDAATGTLGVNLLDAQYGTAGTIMTLSENPSSW